jgi:hypothetical protein
MTHEEKIVILTERRFKGEGRRGISLDCWTPKFVIESLISDIVREYQELGLRQVKTPYEEYLIKLRKLGEIKPLAVKELDGMKGKSTVEQLKFLREYARAIYNEIKPLNSILDDCKIRCHSLKKMCNNYSSTNNGKGSYHQAEDCIRNSLSLASNPECKIEESDVERVIWHVFHLVQGIVRSMDKEFVEPFEPDSILWDLIK